MDNRITNEQGQVAVKWVLRRMPPQNVKIDSDGTVYQFVPRQNVFMAWVNPAHVDSLLSVRMKTCNCNGGTKNFAFMLCNQLDVNLWVYGTREGKPS